MNTNDIVELESINNSDDDDDNDEKNDDQDSHNHINEMTVTSISQLKSYRIEIPLKNNDGEINNAFQADESLKSVNFDHEDDDNNKNKESIELKNITSSSKSSLSSSSKQINRLRSLVMLPEQLDARTKIELKRIETKFLTNINELSLNYKIKIFIYNFLNYPNNLISFIYHILIASMLLIYLGFVMFESESTWEENCFIYLKQHSLKSYYELLLFIHFLIEFVLRFLSSRVIVPYRNLNTIRWMIKYFFGRLSHLFDIFLLICGILSTTCFLFPNLPIDFTQDLYALIMLRGLHRLYNVIQWISVQKRDSTWKILLEVFYDGGQLLFSTFYVVILMIFLVSYGIYLAETNPDKDHDKKDVKIDNLMNSLYATSITLLTVGFGDYSPITYVGQAIMGIGIWIALALFAIPSGLIATSVAIKVSEQENNRKAKMRKILATILIQRAWRFSDRQKQFEMAVLLNRIRQMGQESLLPIKTNKLLWHKIDHVLENKSHFYATQFIQLILLNRARKKFRKVMTPNDDPRPEMKSYQYKNNETINIMEKIQQQLEQMIDDDKNYLSSIQMFDFQIKQMEKKLMEQNKFLKELLLKQFPNNEYYSY